jgi:hypothetical protein
MVFGSLYNSGYNSNSLMFIRGDGNVGIGNTAPSQILHVTGNIRVTGAYYDSGNSAGTSGQILSSTATGTSWIAATGGSVTSVDLTAGTGISVSGGPITTSGSITVTNTAPDQTVVLTASTGITTSGTYPNFTIANSAPDQTVVLTAGTGITTSGAYPSFTVTNSAPDQTVVLTAGTGITTSGTYPSFTVTNDDRGSSQNIFKNIAVAGQSTIVADSNDDTLTVVAGTGISLTTNDSTDTLTITNTAATSIASFAGIAGGRLDLTTSGTSYKALWTTNPIKDATVYTHSTSVNAGDITLDAGTYEIELGYSANNTNNGATATVAANIAINGVTQNPYSVVEIENAIIMSTSFSFIFSISKNDIITTSFIPTYVGGSTGTMAIDSNGTYITIKKIG